MRSGISTLLVQAALAMAAVAAVVVVLWSTSGSGAGPSSADQTAVIDPSGPEHIGAPALDGPARRELDAAPVLPGAAPSGPDPAVELTDPAAVARAYVVAAFSVTDADAGHTNRRGAPYAEPGGPVALGVVVLDAPAPGMAAAAWVTAVTPTGSDPSGVRRSYAVAYLTRIESVGTPGTGGPAATPGATGPAGMRYLLLVHQPDGRWLVAADTPDPPNAGE
jgi:hypothetical protein